MTDIDLSRHPKGHLVGSVIEPDNTRQVTFVFSPDEWAKFGVSVDPESTELTFPRFHHLIPAPETETIDVEVEDKRQEIEDVAFAKVSMEERRAGRRRETRPTVDRDESRLP